jgi:hypothetical protein
MKKIITLLLLITFSTGFSQNQTLSEILELKKKNKSEVKEYLLDKNWKVMHDHYSEEMKFGDIRFAYGNSNPDKQTPEYVNFYHQGDELVNNRIEYVVSDTAKFDLLLGQIKSSGFKFISTKDDINQVTEIYQNETTTIEVKTKPADDYFGISFYTFYITDNNYKRI